MTQLIKNAARSALAAGIGAADTSLTVDITKADLFPAANTGTDPVNTIGKDWFKIVVEDASHNYEIIYVRTRTLGSAVMGNLLRGQEGTTAISFSAAGSIVGLRITADDYKNALDLAAVATTYGKSVLAADSASKARAVLGFPATTADTVIMGNGTDFVSIPYDNDPVNDNGTFEVNQRGSTSVADDTYFVDRYYILTESGNVTVAQTTDPEDGAPWGIRLTQPDASAKRMGVATIIESKNCRKLRNAVATLAARVKLSTGGALRYAILEHTGTANSVTSDVVNNWSSTNFTASNFFIAGINVLQCGTVTPGAATWGDLAGYGTVGASMNNLICFVWTEAAAAQNVTLDINRFRCVPGAVALPIRFNKNEKQICQQSYWQSKPGSGDITLHGYAPGAGGLAYRILGLPVTMLSDPHTVNFVGIWAGSNVTGNPTVGVATVDLIRMYITSIGAGEFYVDTSVAGHCLKVSADL